MSKNVAVRTGTTKTGEAILKPVKIQRYRAGQVPENYYEDIDEDEDSEEEREAERLRREKEREDREGRERRKGKGKEREDTVVNAVERIEISEQDVASDRRLRRLQEAKEAREKDMNSEEVTDRRRRRHYDDDDDEQMADVKKIDEDDDADEAAERRRLMKQRALEQLRKEEEAQKKQAAIEGGDDEEEEEEEEEEDKESSEYETDSEEESSEDERKLLKPIFIPRQHRETILEKERQERDLEEAELARERMREERKKESHQLVAELVKKELQGELPDPDAPSGPPDVDDTDNIDDQAEYELWKLRELTRIKRDKEERLARETEQEEIERRRAIPEHIRLAEDLTRARESREAKSKTQQTYLQKYYHKGAFYMDREEELFTRDYSAPTLDEVNHKESLPEVMQVKNFGRSGRTKWTHLTKEDTSKTDGGGAWSERNDITKRMVSKLGGMHGGFEKPTKKRRL